jgi:hypothetical protein
LAVSTAVLTLGLWFLFDRTRNGFLLGLASGVSGTIIVFKLVQLGIFEYFLDNADFRAHQRFHYGFRLFCFPRLF